MALETPPFEVHIEKWKQEVQQFGYGRTDPPGILERRMREDNGRYFLEIWNGDWIKLNEYTANEILQLLLTVHGENSGLDSDTVDGKHSADLQNAANLTGTVARARLGDLWRDSDTNQTNSPYFQTGTATVTAGTGTQFIPFDYAYTETPKVTTGSNWPHICKIATISTTGLTMIPHSTTPYIVYFIALGRR